MKPHKMDNVVKLSKTEPSSLRQVLNKLMRQTNTNINQLSKNTGISNTTIKRMCTDPDCNPTLTSISKIAEFFGITPNQLIGKELLLQEQLGYKPNFEQWIPVPILNLDQVVRWPSNLEEIKEAQKTKYVKTDLEINERVFAIIAQDESLEPKFSMGTILIFDPEKIPKNKDYILFLSEDKNLPQFRQILIDGSDWYTKIINPEFSQGSPIPIDKNKNRILGTLIQAKSNYID